MGRGIIRLILIIVIVLSILTGCQQANKNNSTKTLTIGAAASLNEAFTELGEIFAEDNPDWVVEFTFAGSGNLKTSIQQGAPIDVFASAAEKQMEELKASGHILEETIQVMARNEMVLIVPKDSRVNTLDDLLALEKIALGQPDTVPAGQYSKESLIALGYWDKLADKLVYTKDVRQVLFYVERDEVDGGFVYATDSVKSDTIRVALSLPESSYQSPIYPIGMVAETDKAIGARKWIDLVISEKGQEVLGKYGFKKP